jgi:hypothetical protein
VQNAGRCREDDWATKACVYLNMTSRISALRSNPAVIEFASILIASPGSCTTYSVCVVSRPPMNALIPTTSRLPMAPASVLPSRIETVTEIMQVAGKYSARILSPGLWMTWPRKRGIGVNCPLNRLRTSPGRRSSRRLLAFDALCFLGRKRPIEATLVSRRGWRIRSGHCDSCHRIQGDQAGLAMTPLSAAYHTTDMSRLRSMLSLN